MKDETFVGHVCFLDAVTLESFSYLDDIRFVSLFVKLEGAEHGVCSRTDAG
jgi:hypothetical protein